MDEIQGDQEMSSSDSDLVELQPSEVITGDLESTLPLLEQLRRERDEYKDKYFRQLAEGENMRKRLQREKLEYAQFAVQGVVTDFLKPIEHMENALQYAGNMSEEVRNWAKGFEMILGQLKQVLADQGVTPIAAMGCEFDPHCHEAVEVVVTTDQAPGTILGVTSKGYRMDGRTILAARVSVAKAPEITEEKF